MALRTTALVLVALALIAPGTSGSHPGTTLHSQAYEYYVLGSPEATAAGVGPLCHVGEYRGYPLSIGGVCFNIPAEAIEVGIRIQNGGLEATHAQYEFRDAEDATLDQGEVCATALLGVPTGSVRLRLSLETLSGSADCPNPRPAITGYVGADFYAAAA